ncbi:MAG: zinc-binding dehydrogenase [Chloroflexi bacterium]|nr:zinc-binding dehydrogenase [Chloroflexota bacterium]
MSGERGRVAAFYGPGKSFELKEYAVPDPEPGALVLKIRIANVCGSDLHQWRGEFDVAKFGRPYPQILGHEMVTTVQALGAGVTHDTQGQPVSVGDRVVFRSFIPCGRCRACVKRIFRACPNARTYLNNSCDVAPHFFGAFADYHYLKPGAAFFKVPDEISDQMAAGINCAFSQVVGGLQLAQLKLGENVVIQGAGGLGVYATAVAKELGAGRVIVIDGIPERLELARQFGADELIDLQELRTPDERVQRVLELTDGWGADVVAELVGHPRVVPEGLRMVGRTGRYLEIGNISPGLTYEIDPSQLIFRNITMYGMVYYEAEHLQQALELMSRTRTKYPWDRVLSHSYALEDIETAFQMADQGRVTRAAIVL